MKKLILFFSLVFFSFSLITFNYASDETNFQKMILGSWKYFSNMIDGEVEIWEFTSEPFVEKNPLPDILAEKVPEKLFKMKYFDANGKLKHEGCYGFLENPKREDVKKLIKKNRRKKIKCSILYLSYKISYKKRSSYKYSWMPISFYDNKIKPIKSEDWKLEKILKLGIKQPKTKPDRLAKKIKGKQPQDTTTPSKNDSFDFNKLDWEKWSNQQRERSWVGEKVTLLGMKPIWCNIKDSKDEIHSLFYFNDPKKKLPEALYAGKIGIITESTPKIVIELDETKEKVVTNNVMDLGFHSELKAAKTLIGCPLWAKGKQTLANPNNLGLNRSDERRSERINIKNTSKVIVSDVKFGKHLQQIFLYVKTEDGIEACLDGYDGYDYYDTRFHKRKKYGLQHQPITSRFYFQNPRTLYPGWSEAVWEIIREGEIAVGMTLKMAKVAGGKKLEKSGFMLFNSGKESGIIYKIGIKKFVVKDGKVLKIL